MFASIQKRLPSAARNERGVGTGLREAGGKSFDVANRVVHPASTTCNGIVIGIEIRHDHITAREKRLGDDIRRAALKSRRQRENLRPPILREKGCLFLNCSWKLDTRNQLRMLLEKCFAKQLKPRIDIPDQA